MKNYKKLAIAAALLFGVQGAFATDITGVTGVNGVFNIDPTAVKGDIGFRQYEKFNLSAGDIANLIYKYGIKDISTFVNLVDSKININGLVNTMRDGNFYNGHAIFVSPNGMVVGASGVLNVGSLSVAAPTEANYKKIVNNPASFNLATAQKDANADVKIDGHVFSRGSVDIVGKTVDINGKIFNGATTDMAVNSDADVQTLLFDSLVNYDAAKASNKALDAVDGKIVIRSNHEDGGMNIAGSVINTNKGDVQIINDKGVSGMKISGNVENLNGGNLLVYNKDGMTTISGNVSAKNSDLMINDSASGLTLDETSKVVVDNGDLRIINHGANGLQTRGSIVSKGEIAMIKNTKGDAYIGGDIDMSAAQAKQIINNSTEGLMYVNGKIATGGSAPLYIKNQAAQGLVLDADIINEGGDSTIINNKAGNLIVNGSIKSDADISVANSGEHLSITDSSDIAGNGKIVIKNSGTGNTYIYGVVDNKGEVTSIIGNNGTVEIGGVVSADGNIGIKARGEGMNIKEGALIGSTGGKVLIQNKGANGMYIYGDVLAVDELNIVNNKGILGSYGELLSDGDININNLNKGDQALILGSDIDGKNVTITNSAKGGIDFYNGKIATDESTTIINHAGDLNINGQIESAGNASIQNSGNGRLLIASDGSVKGNGTVVVYNKADGGLYIGGKVANNGDVMSITNKKGDLVILGSVISEKGNLGIVNKDQGGALKTTDTAEIINKDGKTNIINACEGGMDLDGTINTTGELNIINDAGYGVVKADITSAKTNLFSRKASKGLDVIKKDETPVVEPEQPEVPVEENPENPTIDDEVENPMEPDAE